MSRAKLITKNLYMDNHTFRQAFLTSLTKLNDAATRKLGLEEIRHLLIVHVQDSDRFNSVLSIISENNEYQKIGAKRESAKIIRIISEVFEEHLIRFIPKIIQVVYRKLQEDDNQLHENLSDAMGDLVRTSLGHVETEIACTAIRTILNKLFQLCAKDTKHIQTGSALCISKIIQATPFPCLELLLDEIASRIADLLKQTNCRSHLQLFECVLSYMMGFKDDRERLEKSAELMLPITLYHMANTDWNVRRVAVQVLHVMSILAPEIIKPDLDEIVEALNHCRFDKIKNVRDVTATTLAYVQKLTPPETPVTDKRRLEISFERVPSLTKSRDLTKTPTSHSRGQSTEKRRWPSNILVDLEERKNSIELSLSQRERAKSVPRHRPKSVEGRRNRQVNPNFFSNTLKNSGDVEIFTKTPTPEPLAQSQTTMGHRVYSSNSIKISDVSRTNTPSSNKRNIEPNMKQRVSKNYDEISASNVLAHDFEDVESVLFSSPTAPSNQFQKYFKDREKDRKPAPKKEQLAIPVNSIRNSRPSLELGYIDGKNLNLNLNLTQTNSKSKIQPEETVHDNLGQLVKKLDTLNKQQSKTINSISGFHNTTNSEIDRIKGRLNHLEVFMQKDNQTKVPHQPMSYAYSPAYTPPYTPTYLTGLHPPPAFQFPYQTQYANYSSNSNFYPTQGMRADPTINLQTGNTSPKKTYASGQSYQNSCMSTNSLIMPNLAYDMENEEQRADLSNTSVSNYKRQVTINTNNGSKRSSPTRALSRTLSYKRLGERRESREDSSILKSRDGKQENENKALEAKLRELLDEDHINVAYEMCLKRGDENTLLSLMVYSGNVMKQLDIPIVESLLMKLKNKLTDKTKSGLIIDWMEKVAEDNLAVSKDTLLGMHEKLIERLEAKDTLSGTEYRRMKNLSDNLEIMIDLEENKDK